MKNQLGISLIEIITTMTILAIVGFFSLPSIASWQTEVELRAEVRQVIASLMRAKLEAIKSNQYVVTQFTGSGYKTFVDDGANGGVARDWVCQTGERVVGSYAIMDGLILSTNFVSDRMRFTGNIGTVGGTITLSYKSIPYSKVVVSLTGRVRAEKF